MKRRHYLNTLLALVISALLGCTQPVRLTEADQATLRRALDDEMQAANAGNAAAWASLYAPDAIVLRPHATAVEGRESIQRWLATLPRISNAKGEVQELDGDGDLAYSRGNYRMSFTIPGVPMPIEERGKFVQIFRRQNDGSWRMTREIYNSDLPLPTPQ